jgi:hypothetical protein
VKTKTPAFIAIVLCISFVGVAASPSFAMADSDHHDVSQRSETSANWPRFRGPNGAGLSDASIPAKWTDADYNWKIKLPGGGNSSPAIWGDRIFLTCGNDETGDHMVVCINAGDGSVRWTRTYPSQSYKHHQFNSYASSTPAVDEKYVYVCWSTPEEFTLLALDHDGKDLWQKGLGPFISQHGGGQSPIAYQGMVIVGDDQEGPESFVFALDRETGAEVWKTKRKPSNKFAPATPCVFQPKSGPPQLIFVNKSQGFTAIDPKDGHTIWAVLPEHYDARPVAPAATAPPGMYSWQSARATMGNPPRSRTKSKSRFPTSRLQSPKMAGFSTSPTMESWPASMSTPALRSGRNVSMAISSVPSSVPATSSSSSPRRAMSS